MTHSDEVIREAKALIERARKLLDECGHDLAAVHLQEAIEVLEHGHVLKPIIDPI